MIRAMFDFKIACQFQDIKDVKKLVNILNKKGVSIHYDNDIAIRLSLRRRRDLKVPKWLINYVIEKEK
jgi:UDP-N-acetylglucosamine enolpyruvyl transferase